MNKYKQNLTKDNIVINCRKGQRRKNETNLPSVSIFIHYPFNALPLSICSPARQTILAHS